MESAKKTFFVLLIILLISACTPQTGTARAALFILQELFEIVIHTKKYGKNTITIAANLGKITIQAEREVNGIKIASSLPLEYATLANAAYQAMYGKPPDGDFDPNEAAGILIIENNFDRLLYVIDSDFFCIADTMYPSEIRISQRKVVLFKVTSELQNIEVGTDENSCNEISMKVSERVEFIKRNEAAANIGISKIYNQDSSTIDFIYSDRKIIESFDIDLFLTSNKLDHLSIEAYYQEATVIKEKCIQDEIEVSPQDMENFIDSLYICMKENSYSKNDQNYIIARGLYENNEN